MMCQRRMIMSYIDIYRSCHTFDELQERVLEDVKIAEYLESPFVPIVNAIFTVMKEKGWHK